MTKEWITIAGKEIRTSLRDRTWLAIVFIFYLLVATATWGGYTSYRVTKFQREKAEADFRHEWEEQHANPHSAAHFGTWLFKPSTILSLFDIGLNRYTGVSYRVEAHKQHEVNFANVRDRDGALRFGELTPAMLFQILVPLLIIVSAFSSFTREKEEHTLKILLAQGIAPYRIMIGKLLGNYAVVLMVTLPVFLCMLLSVVIYPVNGAAIRVTGLITVYFVYFFIVCAIVVFISACSATSRSSLLVNISVWITVCILMPRIAAAFADRAFRLPSRYDFNQNVLKGYTKGLDGDSNYVVRDKIFRQQILKKYRVDSISQLPVNIGGLSMQNGEDYNSKVYALYEAQVEDKINSQQSCFDSFSFMDPLVAVKQLSMGFSGTDYQHHVDFHRSARFYRDGLIRKLNMRLAANKPLKGARYVEEPGFFKSIEDFQYSLPRPGIVWKRHAVAVVALFCWLMLVLFLVYPISSRIKPI